MAFTYEYVHAAVPGTYECYLVWQRAYAGVIKGYEMGGLSCIIGTRHNHSRPYKGRKRHQGQTRRWRDDEAGKRWKVLKPPCYWLWRWRTGPRAREYRWPLETDPARKQMPCSEPPEGTSPANTLTVAAWNWLQTSDPRSLRLNSYCFKRRTWWWFVIVATGN